jgi:hypothetical protein
MQLCNVLMNSQDTQIITKQWGSSLERVQSTKASMILLVLRIGTAHTCSCKHNNRHVGRDAVVQFGYYAVFINAKHGNRCLARTQNEDLELQ